MAKKPKPIDDRPFVRLCNRCNGKRTLFAADARRCPVCGGNEFRIEYETPGLFSEWYEASLPESTP